MPKQKMHIKKIRIQALEKTSVEGSSSANTKMVKVSPPTKARFESMVVLNAS